MSYAQATGVQNQERRYLTGSVGFGSASDMSPANIVVSAPHAGSNRHQGRASSPGFQSTSAPTISTVAYPQGGRLSLQRPESMDALTAKSDSCRYPQRTLAPTASAKTDLEGSSKVKPSVSDVPNTMDKLYGSTSEHLRRAPNNTEYDTPLLLKNISKEIDQLKNFIKTRILTEIEDIKSEVSSHLIYERNGSTELTESSELCYSQTADKRGKGTFVHATSIEAAGSRNHEETRVTDHDDLYGGKNTDTTIYTTEIIVSDLSKLLDRIQGHTRDFASKLTATRNSDVKRYTTEERICQYMFYDFECASFGSYTEQLFQNPQDAKSKKIKMYETYKELAPKRLYYYSEEFKNFVKRKESESDLQSIISEFTQGSSDLRDALWTLSKDIWLLHILAFACEPRSAEIFRVPKGSQYVPDYMTLTEKKASGKEKSVGKNRKVDFMTTPGFTLRNRIIKAYVRCSTI